MEKVSLPKYLITVACAYLTLMFFNIIHASAARLDISQHVNILMLESEKFCRRVRMRIVSRGISFARKHGW